MRKEGGDVIVVHLVIDGRMDGRIEIIQEKIRGKERLSASPTDSFSYLVRLV